MSIFLESIILFVKEIEKQKLFYSSHFLFEVEEEIPTSWLLFNSGNFKLALHQIPAEYIDTDDENWNTENNVKLVFFIEEDISVFRQRLLDGNVDVGEMQSWDGYPYMLFDGKDPEGNVFQVKQKKL